MKYKFMKLLSLGLCFCMVASSLVYAAPLQQKVSVRDIEDYGVVSEPKIWEMDNYVLEEDVPLATPSESTPSEATPGEAERRTFLDFFPDPVFAQGVAEHLGKNKEDYISELELSQIDYLQIWYTDLSSIEGIEHLKNLIHLRLGDNKIQVIPDSLGTLEYLEIVELYRNKIELIPDSLSNSNSINNLILHDNLIKTIPDSLSTMINLSTLDLSGNQVQIIPDSLSNSLSLENLCLNMNRIASIPESLSTMQNLKGLDLSGNNIHYIPDHLSNLENLTGLDLSNNRISVIPDSLSELTELRHLSLYHNDISILPDSLSNLENLESLSLAGNQIHIIPSSLGNLNNLKYLHLGYNYNIEIIPDSFSNMVNLEYLQLFRNNIQEIPESLCELRNLKDLSLFDNKIKKIPNSLGNLENLEYVDLSYNEIKSIPSSISNLSNLSFFCIEENNLIDSIPEDVFLIGNLSSGRWLDQSALKNQNGILDSINTHIRSQFSMEMVLSPLIIQLSDLYNDSILPGYWNITTPSQQVIIINAYDGSEIESFVFDEIGNYTVKFIWDQELTAFHHKIKNIQSSITVTILPPETSTPSETQHNVTLTTRYLDDALPESTQTYSVEDGGRFEQQFDVLDGYGLAGMELYTMPDFDVDMDTRTVFLDPVTQDYNIVLEFEKITPREHNVTVITRYLDDALPEHTETYTVPRGSAFLEGFEILEGYELAGTELRSMPDFDVDMINKQISLDPVNQDHIILLEFDKIDYRVKLTTKYLDNAYPDNTQTTRVRYNDPYHQTYQIAEGYQVANLDQLPADVIVDEANNTVTINNVTEPYNIVLEFEKKQFNVTITIIYEDGFMADQVSAYTVPYGDPLETSFIIDEDYSISKVSFNAMGVSVNKNQQTVKIRSVTSPIQITIRVK